MNPAEKLIPQWLERAETLLRYAADERAASLWRLAADELEEATRRSDDEMLDLHQAASESGYSVEHLGRLVRRGEIQNSGRKHAPRIRRRDLPKKPLQHEPTVAHAHPPSHVEDRLFRDIVASKNGGN